MNKSEAGHWYDRSGEPMYRIVGANGKERNTTLRDAKSLGLVPSVTTVMKMIAVPSLENWKMNQLLNSVMSLKQDENESDIAFMYRCKEDSNKIGKKAAEIGTKIHAQIEKGFLGKSKTKAYKAVRKILDEKYPNEKWIAEPSFCAKEGYGGKIDLYSKSGIFVDFKTKDNLKEKDAKNLVYDSHGIQLSAYAQGCGYEKPERVSIFIDRKDTSVVLCYVWEQDTHERHLGMFNSILNYWKLSKNYDSAEKI